MKSPVTNSEHTILEREIPVSFIVDGYRKDFGMDVKDLFKSVDKIKIYRCLDTGYRFYYPFAAGDDGFYQQLERFPWYYMDWKWEHGIAAGMVSSGDKILEVGCARGGFLQKIKKGGADVEGLELNSSARKECAKRGIRAYPDSIEDFSKTRAGQYDLACSFQVLEHVPDVKSFIDASLKILKPGGTLIISVPNNDSLMIKNKDHTLNIPPHHMGLWNLNSLIKLQRYFPMDIDEAYLEPLQEYHLSFALKDANKNVMSRIKKKAGPLTPLAAKPAKLVSYAAVSAVREWMIGHTILVSYKKRNA